MKVAVKQCINAPIEKVNQAVINFDSWAQWSSSIVTVEVQPSPNGEFVGTQVKETRKMMKYEETQTLIVHEYRANDYLCFHTEMNSALVVSEHFFKKIDAETTELTLQFGVQGLSGVQRILGFLFGWLGLLMSKKMLRQDLTDLKKYLEQ